MIRCFPKHSLALLFSFLLPLVGETVNMGVCIYIYICSGKKGGVLVGKIMPLILLGVVSHLMDPACEFLGVFLPEW